MVMDPMNPENRWTERDDESWGQAICLVLAIVAGVAAIYCLFVGVPRQNLGLVCAGLSAICLIAALIYPEAPLVLARSWLEWLLWWSWW